MSVIGNALLLGGDAGAPSYLIDRSVRLRSSASASLSRTFTTPTNQAKWTWSGWVKRGALGSLVRLMSSGTTASDTTTTTVYFSASDTLAFSGGTTNFRVSNQVFRDTSAWYHIVIAVDTTQAVEANKILVYVNGLQITFATTSAITTCAFNSAQTAYIGTFNSSQYFDGYLAEVNFIDGQALKPTAFGEYDAVRNTQWKPKAYSGSWGTNGFYLKFANPASIGLDSSGNGNNWTASAGIQTSNSALTTYDSMLDVPTLTSADNANFATLNPLSIMGSGNTLTNGNLTFAGNGSTNIITTGTFGVSSGKWYVEATITSATGGVGFGIAKDTEPRGTGTVGNTVNTWGYNSVNGVIANNSSTLSTGATYTTNDVVAFALDMDAGTLTFYKNNAAQGSTVTGLSGTFLVAVSGYLSTINTNFGQRPFTHPVPSGFKSLNTYNLPDPTIASGDDYHKVYTYTGNGGGLQVGEIQKPLSLYNLDRSLRFKGVNSYFDKVFASGGANTKGTLSFWVKRSKLGVQQELVRFGTTGTLFSGLYFSATDTLNFVRLNSTYQTALYTTRVFRDPNAWYHIVVAWDSTLGPSSNSVKIYINGIQETVFTSSTYPSASLDMYFFTAGTHNIGRYPVGGNYFGGYMAEFHAVDGQQLTPDSFGQFDGNYYWTPKDYTGGYGTNGWHLDFEDFSSMSATGIGKDVSGLGNNFTPYNFNVTVPANTNVAWDSMVDVPTLNSADVANFCTLNPLSSNASGIVPQEGNLYLPASATNNYSVVGTLGVSTGKWYFECKSASGYSMVGVTTLPALPANIAPHQSGSLAKIIYAAAAAKYDNGTSTAYGATWTTTDVIGIALDMDAGTLTFYKNGTSLGVAFTGLTGVYYPVFGGPNSYAIGYINFGQRPFDQTVPTGHKAINSFNVAEVTGDLESPDFVWIKSRSAATGHALFNSVTGVGKYLSSNATTTETTDVNSLIQFNKNGFLLGNAAIVNTSAATYVASAWKKGATQGLDIVTFTNTSSSASFNHSLGVTPSMIILKGLGPTAANWTVFHKSLANMTTAYLNLNGTPANVGTLGTAVPAPTSTTFGSSSAAIPASQNSIAFLFAEVAGFSKFGSYVGNGSAASPPDGAFVYLGFRPNFVLVKNYAGTAEGWVMWDSSRNTYNTMPNVLYPNLTNAEGSGTNIDFLSNGFKLRNTAVNGNISGNSYIYMAFAEHPFKYSLAR